MNVLFDGDLVAFRCAASGENDDVGIVQYYIDQLVDLIMQECKGDKYEMFLSGKNNFRYDVYPEYKGNRDGTYVPRWREAAKQYLVEKYSGVISEGCEADDLMGISQCAQDGTVIASLDKDLLMIPGHHYSWEISGRSKSGPWTKHAIYREVEKIDGLRWFYTQCITGDVADNMKGIVGRGKKFAEALLDELDNEQDMFDAVREEFGIDEEFLLNGRCLWIWQKENDDWLHRYNELKGEDDPSVS